MKYSHNYKKLGDCIYSTIRRYKKGNVGDIIIENHPKGIHKAKIIREKRNTLDNLPIELLQRDTDLETREDIYELFQSFYRTPIDFNNEKFYIYWLEKI